MNFKKIADTSFKKQILAFVRNDQREFRVIATDDLLQIGASL